MLLIKSQINKCYGRHNLTFCVLKEAYRNISTKPRVSNKTAAETNSDSLQSLIEKYESKILHNSAIESKRIKLGYRRNNAYVFKTERYNELLKDTLASIQPVPISLKYISENSECKKLEESSEIERNVSEKVAHFPYTDNVPIKESSTVIEDHVTEHKANVICHEIRQRYELMKDTANWMTDYDNFEDDLVDSNENNDRLINYGTPDPSSEISNVPCGGCGALLHCKDTAIPGYIPSEIFKNYNRKGAASLEAMICQRCYFLKEHNVALQVRVSPDDYPKVLTTIRSKRALVVLMVDLMDFPCSIWPGIADILGTKTPIVVAGNKVDLLPKDGQHFFNRVKQVLLDHIKLSGFATSNILHVSLISAKTGFGVENLITSLQSLWKHKGDVYLVGCTNVGKSSLFNALLQSDYCKIQAQDLIQRATTSQWPGTTLNLLKFPIMRPSGYRLYLRHKRLETLKQIVTEENRLRNEHLKTSNIAQNATFIGHIGHSYSQKKDDEEKPDLFSVRGNAGVSGRTQMGINEKHRDYALSRWCFDTPGVIQPDQILHLLTVEELMDTLPKQIIRPETFCVKPGTTLFIAGLARLDYLDGHNSVRLTVFRSNELPITVCRLEDAEQIYQDFLGTELFKVPINNSNRLAKWPGLEPAKPIAITGTDRKSSCNDIVLSSAGWVAINCTPENNYKFQAWTPEKRGIHVRDSLLPKAVTLRGARIRFSVAYRSHRFI